MAKTEINTKHLSTVSDILTELHTIVIPLKDYLSWMRFVYDLAKDEKNDRKLKEIIRNLFLSINNLRQYLEELSQRFIKESHDDCDSRIELGGLVGLGEIPELSKLNPTAVRSLKKENVKALSEKRILAAQKIRQLFYSTNNKLNEFEKDVKDLARERNFSG